jgi:hypothetical protein
MRLRTATGYLLGPVLFAGFIGWSVAALAQSKATPKDYPERLPYSFSNFPWWSDDELRAALKTRIPALGDEVATTSSAVGGVRQALTAILKEKGIKAEVQSEEPSYSALHPQEAEEPDFWGLQPEVPKPHIEFSILTPEILIEKVELRSDLVAALQAVQAEARGYEGKPYSAFVFSFMQYRAEKVLRQTGYLTAGVQLNRGPVRQAGGDCLVSLSMIVSAGPRYTVSDISADGGPLLRGRDLSSLFTVKVGDAAGRDPFQRVDSSLRRYYESAGYLDVKIESQPTLDKEHAKVAYHMNVVPGPVYRLRQLAFKNLSAEQESRVRELLGMKTGDLFSAESVDGLSAKCEREPLLKGKSIVSEIKKDSTSHSIDLTLSSFN